MNSLTPQRFPRLDYYNNSNENAKGLWYDGQKKSASYLIGSGAAQAAAFLGSDWESEDHVDTDTNQRVWAGMDSWNTIIKPDNDLGYFRKKTWAPGVGLTITSYPYNLEAAVLYPIWKKNGDVFGRMETSDKYQLNGTTDLAVLKISDDTIIFFSYARRNNNEVTPTIITKGYNKLTKEWHEYLIMPWWDTIGWIDLTDGTTQYTSVSANSKNRCVKGLIGDRGVMLSPLILQEIPYVDFPDIKLALYGYANYNKLIKVKDRWYNTTILAGGSNIYLDVTDFIQD